MKALTGRIVLAGVTVLLALTVVAFSATGQLATELFIPLGQSPGLSSKNSLIGTVKAVDTASRTVTIGGADGAKIVSLTDRTRIWLDRSKIKRTNIIGAPSELRAGRRIEIKFESADRQRVADWIKIEITTPN